jgi:serine/threonine protein kinase
MRINIKEEEVNIILHNSHNLLNLFLLVSSEKKSNMEDNQYDVYVYVKFLGQGSFGRVNLYRNTTDNSLVVWKEIALNLLDTKMRNEAFAEVEILAMLDHPNIIGYYKHYIADDTNHLYIELEYAKAGVEILSLDLIILIKYFKKCSNLKDANT